jgi:predicted TIM-barrel fold metal-dependent hydrolase
MSSASSTETAIEPGIAICDPHHHLWTYAQNPYLPEHLAADIAGGHRVVATVHVECRHGWRTEGPEALRPVGETEFVASCTAGIAGPTRIAAAIVAFADFRLGAAVEGVLEAHLAASRRIRGIRYLAAWDASDQIHNAPTDPSPHLLADARFREGIRCVEKLGLVFDAWVYHPQIPDVTGLARAFPGLTIVLDHVGGPLGIGPYAGRRSEVFESWRHDMQELAACANVVVKLGGLTMSAAGFGWHKRPAPPGSAELAEAMAPYYRSCIEWFGPRRCMFESNFPIDRVSCPYTTLWNAFKRIAADLPEADRRAVFHDTAARVYGLEA